MSSAREAGLFASKNNQLLWPDRCSCILQRRSQRPASIILRVTSDSILSQIYSIAKLLKNRAGETRQALKEITSKILAPAAIPPFLTTAYIFMHAKPVRI
jgi:hypothetical protein